MQIKHFKGFRFKAFWIGLSGFKEEVLKAWSKPVRIQDSIKRLHIKLARTARALKLWHRKYMKNLRFKEEIANEVIFQLDLAQEDRELTSDERAFRGSLKAKLLGFAALEELDGDSAHG